MSGFFDLCECICRQLQRNMQSVEQILERVNGQQISHSNGDSLSFVNSPATSSGDMSPATLLGMTFLILFLFMLFNMRSRPTDATVEKRTRPHDDSGPSRDSDAVD